MYSFQTGAGKRKNKQTVRILSVVIFVLVIALAGVTFSYIRISGVSRTTNDALMARATSEANEAQSAVYRLTQSSGTNTMNASRQCPQPYLRASMPEHARFQHLRRRHDYRR